jgi:myo-inositol 2-dehydrogenase / D-chiro-inositol 1-dehydrogenase
MRYAIRRRDFVKTAVSAAAVAGFAAGKAPARAEAGAPPSEKITLGCIGMGTHGIGWNLRDFLKIPDARVAAVCDVFRDRREKARDIVNEKYGTKDCEAIADFQAMLARDDIDAVVISTPDHWHVLMSVMAARAGKDVFCEKPTLTIEEGQVLRRVMKETGVIYQGGIEDRSVEIYHRMAELVRNGCLGKLNEIRITLPPGENFPIRDAVPVPAGLDFDRWLGPAPASPYWPEKLDPQAWRNNFDYSGGKLTDWGAHLIDTAQVAIFETHGGPVEVNGKGNFPEGTFSNTATEFDIRYRYANGVEMRVESKGTGIAFFGTEGWIKSPAWRKPIEASSPDILNAVIPPEKNRMYPLPPSEHQAFIDSVKSRKAPYYSPEDIHRLSTAMHIGNISMRLGKKLRWDPVKEEFPGEDAANAMRSKPMREPWTLKG